MIDDADDFLDDQPLQGHGVLPGRVAGMGTGHSQSLQPDTRAPASPGGKSAATPVGTGEDTPVGTGEDTPVGTGEDTPVPAAAQPPVQASAYPVLGRQLPAAIAPVVDQNVNQESEQDGTAVLSQPEVQDQHRPAAFQATPAYERPRRGRLPGVRVPRVSRRGGDEQARVESADELGLPQASRPQELAGEPGAAFYDLNERAFAERPLEQALEAYRALLLVQQRVAQLLESRRLAGSNSGTRCDFCGFEFPGGRYQGHDAVESVTGGFQHVFWCRKDECDAKAQKTVDGLRAERAGALNTRRS